MLDAYIPEGALSPAAEDKLLTRLTDLLLQHEGVDPANRAAHARVWALCTAPRSTSAARSSRAPSFLASSALAG